MIHTYIYIYTYIYTIINLIDGLWHWVYHITFVAATFLVIVVRPQFCWWKSTCLQFKIKHFPKRLLVKHTFLFVFRSFEIYTLTSQFFLDWSPNFCLFEVIISLAQLCQNPPNSTENQPKSSAKSTKIIHNMPEDLPKTHRSHLKSVSPICHGVQNPSGSSECSSPSSMDHREPFLWLSWKLETSNGLIFFGCGQVIKFFWGVPHFWPKPIWRYGVNFGLV